MYVKEIHSTSFCKGRKVCHVRSFALLLSSSLSSYKPNDDGYTSQKGKTYIHIVNGYNKFLTYQINSFSCGSYFGCMLNDNHQYVLKTSQCAEILLILSLTKEPSWSEEEK